MKHIALIIFLIFAKTVISYAQVNQEYDSTLAAQLGADDRGMKIYILAILNTGPKDSVITNQKERDSLFVGHFANIEKMAENGKLVVAGPFEKNKKNFRGLFILNTKSMEEAKTLLKNDPTITTGIFRVDYFEWYGSAALPMYIDYQNKVRKN